MTDEKRLDELVTRYANLKSEMDSYKKQVDEDNKSIKELMSSNNLKEHTAGGYTAKYSVIVSESFDEDKLLNKLVQNLSEENYKKVVKTKEYVDMDALENAIYNGKINPVDLADCRIKKETTRLTISKVKEKKNDN